VRMFFFFQAEDGIRDRNVTGVQTCALPISRDKQSGSYTKHECGSGWDSTQGPAQILAQQPPTPSPCRGRSRAKRELPAVSRRWRSEEHTSELQSRFDLVCRLLLEKKKTKPT